ncbi:DUF3311 domain-containing protein [Treponema primitia]|uniref:DUF3311 domain-containing protein n=1 Tax=Treponema primitia TaxID=88058 RepID=UPI00397F0A3A
MAIKHYTGRTVLFLLIFIGFLIMEFPGVLFFNRIDPIIFGLPFIYSFTLIMWVIMVVLMYIGYKTNWGKGKNFNGKES